MSLWHLVTREIIHNKWNCLLGLCAITVAVITISGSTTMLNVHNSRTQRLLDKKKAINTEQMKSIQAVVNKAMHRLGFNITILPEKQNLADWHSDDYASIYMNASSIKILRNAKPQTSSTPVAQLRQRLKWTETKWTIILLGTEGTLAGVNQQEIVPIPSGAIHIGHEIHKGLSLKPNSSVKILGKEFRIDKCINEKGSKEDITIFMNLADSQQLLGKQNKINEIVAIEAPCAWRNPEKVRNEISKILPGVTVVENLPKAMTALQARLGAEATTQSNIKQDEITATRLGKERARLAMLLNGIVALICAAWISLLALSNASDRQKEIGLWTALGIPFRDVAFLFWAKWLLLGFAGGILGFGGGIFLGAYGSTRGDNQVTSLWETIASNGMNTRTLGIAVIMSAGLAVLASFIPVVVALRQDPAIVLQNE